jgi:hypothetical protein
MKYDDVLLTNFREFKNENSSLIYLPRASELTAHINRESFSLRKAQTIVGGHCF